MHNIVSIHYLPITNSPQDQSNSAAKPYQSINRYTLESAQGAKGILLSSLDFL